MPFGGYATAGDRLLFNVDETDAAVTPAAALTGTLSDDAGEAEIVTGGETLIITGFTEPASGVVTDNGDGTLKYTPVANFNGVVSFDYTVNDGQGGKATATVRIDVTPVNDPPSAQDGEVTTPEETDVTVALIGADIDADVLTPRVTRLPENGTLYQTADGVTRGAIIDALDAVITDADRRVIYAPGPGAGDGFDSFDFLMNDGQDDSNVATITVNVFAVVAPQVISTTIADGSCQRGPPRSCCTSSYSSS
ncbi:MAG: cadherin-like domain-containing protein [Acidobacteria bacterium]|nr:cadherin-like domain-containing protein [Acidobacteriota bacterium]